MIISFIVPFYNRSDSIERCLNSILVSFIREYDSLEIILIDDNSTDDGAIKAKNFLKNKNINYKLIVNKKNYGSNFSRNIAIKNSSGDWCVILDSDDTIVISAIKLKKFLSEYYDYPFVSFICAGEKFEINSTANKKFIKVDYLFYINNYHKFFEKLDCLNLNIINKEEYEIFDSNIHVGCEFVAWARLLKKYKKSLILNEVGRKYYQDMKNQITKQNRRSRSNDFYYAYKSFYSEVNKYLNIKMKLRIKIRIYVYKILMSIVV